MLLSKLSCSENLLFIIFLLDVLLPFSLFCLTEKMTGVKVSNGGTRTDILEKELLCAHATEERTFKHNIIIGKQTYKCQKMFTLVS